MNGAKEKIRKAKKQGAEEFEVIFRGGEYRFTDTSSFTAEDSGLTENSIVYRAMDGEEVVFKGSVEITNPKISRVTDEKILKRVKEKIKNKDSIEIKYLRNNKSFKTTF